MHILQTIILGVIEGITEFLPVSSTFHLIFVSKLLGIPQDEFAKLFEVFIQSGAIISVVLLYSKEVIKDQDLIKKTLVAFIPTAIIGLVLYKIIKNVFFSSPLLMLAVFIGVGALFIIFEYLNNKNKIKFDKSIKALTYKEAIIVGLIQAAAVIPGVSRAGAVILAMMFFRYKRDEAAKFSFILAIPTVFAASALDLFKERNYLMQHSSTILLLLIGFFTTFIVSYFVVRWLIGYLKTNSLMIFGVYRIVVGIIIFFTLF